MFQLLHAAENCRSKYTSQKCKQRYNTILHFERSNVATTISIQSNKIADTKPVVQKDATDLVLAIHGKGAHVFLATASVLVLDNRGELRKCQAILDSGSQINFVLKKFVNTYYNSCVKRQHYS